MSSIVENPSISCNRTPFLSDGECDRGKVDVRQFEDFPFCDPVDPTPPEVPEETIGAYKSVNTPPSCQCIDIDYDLSAQYVTRSSAGLQQSRRAELYTRNFRAIGDCCSGHYHADMFLEVQCPIVDPRPKKMRATVGYGDGASSQSEVFCVMDKNECTMEFKDVNFNVDLKCPIRVFSPHMLGDEYDNIGGPGDSVLSTNVSFSDNGVDTTQSYVDIVKSGDGDECLSSFEYRPTIDLTIPCIFPPRMDGSITMSAGYRCPDCKAPENKKFHIWSEPECTLRVEPGEYYLTVPCPIPEDLGDDGDISIGVEFKRRIPTEESEGSENRPFKVVAYDCGVSFEGGDYNLAVPCPIPDGLSGDIAMSIKWDGSPGASAGSAGTIPFQTSMDGCDGNGGNMAVQSGNYNLVAPCPIGTVDGSISMSVRYGDKKGNQFPLTVRTAGCGIEVDPGSYDLRIPCPGGSSSATIAMSVGYGDESIITPFRITSADCELSVSSGSYDLRIPCPIDFEGGTVSIKAGYGDSSESNVTPLRVYAHCCDVTVTPGSYDLKLPCPFGPVPVKATASVHVAYGDGSGSSSPVSVKPDGCSLSAETGYYELMLPCPVGDVDGTIKVSADWTDIGGSEESSARNLEIKASDCSLSVTGGEYDLKIPCPIGNIDGRVTMSVGYGESSESKIKALEVSVTDCKVSVTPGEYDLKIPCPVDGFNATVSVDAQYGKKTEVKGTPLRIEATDDCNLSATGGQYKIILRCPIDDMIVVGAEQGKDEKGDLKVTPPEDGKGYKLNVVFPKMKKGPKGKDGPPGKDYELSVSGDCPGDKGDDWRPGTVVYNKNTGNLTIEGTQVFIGKPPEGDPGDDGKGIDPDGVDLYLEKIAPAIFSLEFEFGGFGHASATIYTKFILDE